MYVDIDIYACSLGYRELLRVLGVPSDVVLLGPFNKSVTDTVLTLGQPIITNTSRLEAENEFVVVDISEPNHISKIVNQKKIVKLIDHHFGFEEYWRGKLGDNAIIEKVGACATLVWEQYVAKGISDQIPSKTAKLLALTIASHTLNFKAKVTDKRDIDAFNRLVGLTDWENDLVAAYFKDQDRATFSDPEKTIKNDTLILDYPNIPYKIVIGQLELWNSKYFFENNLAQAKKVLETFGEEHWFLTSPSIEDGRTYLYCLNPETERMLEDITKTRFRDNKAIVEDLWMRKEIKRELLSVKM